MVFCHHHVTLNYAYFSFFLRRSYVASIFSINCSVAQFILFYLTFLVCMNSMIVSIIIANEYVLLFLFLLLFCSEIMATFFANYLSNTPITSFVEMLCFASIYIAVWIASANVSLSQHFQFVHILMHHPKPSIWFMLCSHWTWCSRLWINRKAIPF